VAGGIAAETEQVLQYIESILAEAGLHLDDVVKSTVYLTDMDTYDEMNEVYVEYMSEPFPARTLVAVEELAHDCGIEIEVIAES